MSQGQIDKAAKKIFFRRTLTAMSAYEPFICLAVALGVGLLMGLQREQSAHQSGYGEGDYLGGIRTYPMYALAGALTTLLTEKLTIWLLPAVLLVLSAPLILAYAQNVQQGRDRGLTSEVSFVLAYLLGALALAHQVVAPMSARLLLVAAIGVAVTSLLSMKKPLHDLAQRVSSEDLYSTLKFLVLAVIVLPLLPNKTLGPLDVINPFGVGLMIVLMAGVGFVGYVAIRLLGAGRGLGLTGLIGGLVSSTAVTLSVSGRARNEPSLSNSCALAAILASTVMVARVALMISAVNRDLLRVVAWSLGGLVAGGLVAALVLFLLSRKDVPGGPSGVHLHNPFELMTAFKFGAIFVVVLFISKVASIYFGNRGVYIASLLGGLTDMDAVTLSMSGLAGHEVDLRVAARAILIAAASNTCVKASLALSLGGWYYGKRVLFGCLLILLCGVGAAFASL